MHNTDSLSGIGRPQTICWRCKTLPSKPYLHNPPPRALLERRGRGRPPPPPPPAGMNHIGQELQKCTTLTHSVYTFVIMSEHR